MEYHTQQRRVQVVGSVLVLSCCLLASVVSASVMHTVLWATDDSFFFNKSAPTLEVQMGDAVDFVCPQLIHNQGNGDNENHVTAMQDFSIYKVSADDFERCELKPFTRAVFRCNTPAKSRRYTFHVVQFTAIPGGLEFNCDKSYHFLAVQNGEDITNKTNMCSKYNTKLKIDVRCDIFNKEVTDPSSSDRPTGGHMNGGKPVNPAADEDKTRVNTVVAVCACVGVLIIVVVIILVFVIRRRRKQTKTRTDVERHGSRQQIDIVRSPNDATLKLAVVDITKPVDDQDDEEHMYWTIMEDTTANERTVE